jgi:sugar phosphate isomerase/epimerase
MDAPVAVEFGPSAPTASRAALASVDERPEPVGNRAVAPPEVLLDPETGAFEAFDDLDRIKALADRFNGAAELARSRGMRVGYHNHAWEFGTDFDGRSGLEVFYELCEPDVVAEIDVYWAQIGGRDPVDLVRTLGDRVALLHVKDGDGGGGLTSGPIGTGVIDLPAVLAAATAAEWHLVELEGMDDDTIWPALDSSARFLVEHGLSTSDNG